MANKNSYEKKAHRKQMLSGTNSSTPAKGDFAKSATAMGTDILMGGILGAATGAIIGRGSFFIGMAVSGGGHYFGSQAATAFGVGMMATGGYKMSTGVNGVPVSGLEGLKDRLKAFKDDLKHKLFLDKIMKSKKTQQSTEEATNGLGEVNYFTYNNRELEGRRVNLTALDNIEKQIEQSARRHAIKNQMSGMEGMEGMEGTDGVDGMDGVEDLNL